MTPYTRILVSISNPEDYRLFRRLGDAVPEARIDYIANNLAIYLYLRVKRERVFYPRRKRVDGTPSLRDGFSVRTGRLSEATAEAVYGGYRAFFETHVGAERWDLMVLPSGRLAGQHGLADAARVAGVPTLYTGYGNVDNRIFADPQGTDRQSLLFSDPAILDALDPDLDGFEAWRARYVASRKVSHVVAQAKGVGLKTRVLKFVQILFCQAERALGLCSENEYGLSELRKLEPAKIEFDALPDGLRYAFFPLQVSTDAQVILNYHKGDLIEALREAVAFATSRGLPLVIKPHPAELNQKVLDEIHALKPALGFHISDGNTFRLIDGAEVVVTINSTVGLEAMLMDREVHFLGQTLYAAFDRRRMAAYVSRYLIDEPYFASDGRPFSDAGAQALLARAQMRPTRPASVPTAAAAPV